MLSLLWDAVALWFPRAMIVESEARVVVPLLVRLASSRLSWAIATAITSRSSANFDLYSTDGDARTAVAALDAATALLRAHADADVPDSRVISHLGLDPLSTAALAGERPDLDEPARFAAEHAARHPGLGLFVADGTLVHNAGGSEAQEIGSAIAAGTAYLRALTDAGLEPADAARRIEFRLAANADQFSVIAKLRAVRAMWNQVLEACGLPADQRGMSLHATTSDAMLTRRDPHVNMLRATVACFAAGVGGADAVTVAPFDSAVGLPDDFARRIARNTQSLLIEESHLAQVIDPAGGSFYVEALTRDLYTAGWAFFQELERAGGIAAAIGHGELRTAVDRLWERRRHDLAHRTAPLTGVSEFPDPHEKPLVREPDPARPAPVEGGFPVRRYAQDYESLRDRSDAHTADTGRRPTAFLATLGPVAAHTARASSATDLLAAGGIAVDTPGPLGDARAAAAAFTASGSRIAVICSSDRVYAEHAEAVARALRGVGARRVILAGAPRDAYREAGVDSFAHQGCDAVALLTDLVDVILTDPPATTTDSAEPDSTEPDSTEPDSTEPDSTQGARA